MRAIYVLFPSLFLTACSGSSVSDTLGLGKHNAPDEFEVISRPPLTVPKEFYLSPPQDGSARTDFGSEAHQSARRMVTGLEAGTNDQSLEQAETGLADTAAPVVQSGDLPSGGESAFLQKIGADKADPKVRSQLSTDNNVPEKKEEPSWLDKLRGKGGDEEPVVDATGEKDRIKDNKETGKPATEGETPTVDPSKKSVLGRIFN